MSCYSNENFVKLDSWGMVTESNLSEMKERTARHKTSLIKMGCVVYNMVVKYNNKDRQQRVEERTEAGVNVFISDGTLLGAYRNGEMIAHDYDMDFAMYGTREELRALYEYLVVELSSYNREHGANYRYIPLDRNRIDRNRID